MYTDSAFVFCDHKNPTFFTVLVRLFPMPCHSLFEGPVSQLSSFSPSALSFCSSRLPRQISVTYFPHFFCFFDSSFRQHSSGPYFTFFLRLCLPSSFYLSFKKFKKYFFLASQYFSKLSIF